jgi:hypothetical protein
MTRRSWISTYLVLAVCTLVFQIWVRSAQCDGIAQCGPSYAKGVVWSAVWPASWAVYLAGTPPIHRWLA